MARIIVSKQLEQATGANYILESDGSGNLQFVSTASAVSSNEALTSIVDNTDGTFTYTDEDGGDTDVSVPYIIYATGTYSADADTLTRHVGLVPAKLNGKYYRNFDAYFGSGSGTGQSIILKKNEVTLATVTSLSVGGKGSVAISDEIVATNDVISVEFSTTPSGFSECHGTVTII